MKLVSRLLGNPAKLEPSPSMYNERGYRNWFGGFHRIQDRTAYFSLLIFIMRKPWRKDYWKAGTHYIWRRWVHRMCDTTDFHHDIYCLRDPWVRMRERERQYVEVWKGYYETKV